MPESIFSVWNQSDDMKTFLFMPCYAPVSVIRSFSTAFENFPMSIVAMPELATTSGITVKSFTNSAVFVAFAIAMCVYGARTIAYSLSRIFGISGGIIFLVVFGMMLFNYIYSGAQCALWSWMNMLLVTLLIADNLPQVADTEVAETLGIQELPGADTSADELKQCGRLAACRESRMYRNHKIQRNKFETCRRCGDAGLGFENLSKGTEDRKAHKYYGCSEAAAQTARCPRTADTCPMTEAALQVAGLKMDTSTVCAQSAGTLCVFAKQGDGLYGFAGAVDPSSDLEGLGFPTLAACKAKHPSAECAQMGACKPLDDPPRTNCFCDRYKNVGQYSDPCDFLAANCDEKGPFWAEAQQLVERRKTTITDIIDVDDGRAIVERLDEALGL